jgi:hypothetical protein
VQTPFETFRHDVRVVIDKADRLLPFDAGGTYNLGKV